MINELNRLNRFAYGFVFVLKETVCLAFCLIFFRPLVTTRTTTQASVADPDPVLFYPLDPGSVSGIRIRDAFITDPTYFCIKATNKIC
jgi:hypothetical protein